MGASGRAMRVVRWRDVLVVLTLVSHLLATLGFPLPAAERQAKEGSLPYPCQNHPCGCVTANLCWAGDCCCFTLEEKLAWAEANGIEPPAHVRPLVESRAGRPTLSKQKSCCSEAEHARQGHRTESTPCSASQCEQQANLSCCEQPTRHGEQVVPDGSACPATTSSECSAKKAPHEDQTGSVRWVVGIFARKCRSEGPAGFYLIDPAIVPDLTPTRLGESHRIDRVAPRSDRVTGLPHHPPTPPPRSF